MRFIKAGLWFSAAMLVTTSIASAQSTTGTISGRVIDAQQLPVPGVTVNAESPNLQGIRTAVTSENGDYIITLLPSGAYKISFELSGFQRQERNVTLAPTQVLPVDAVMGPAAVSETVEVVGRSADILTQTAQVATNFKQDLIATLPTTRDINATLLLAPAIHPTGPSGNYSISGSMSFDNLFLVNGVTVNETLRGQAQNLYIEDAIQETTVASAGISAEYGRFSGGVVNVITKSGGNVFTGSFRDTLNNDDWRDLVPKRDGDTFANDTKIDKVVPTYEYTFGGPVMKDRLWFFTAGRLQKQESNRQLVITNIPYTFTDKTGRYEAKGTYSLKSNHRLQGTWNKVTRDVLNNTFSTALSMDLNSLENRKLPEDLFSIGYNGVITPTFFLEGRFNHRHLQFAGSGSKFTDLQKGTLLIDPSGRRYWSATFCGVCTPEDRDNQEYFVKGNYFLSTRGFGSHSMTFGYDNFKDYRFANNHQSGSDYRFLNAPAIVQGTDVIASFVSGTTTIQWNPIFVETAGTDFRTHSVFYNDSWRVSSRLTANLGLRWDRNHGVNSAGELVAKESAFSPRLGVVWDLAGDEKWTVTASGAKYVAALLNSIADITSPGGNSDQYRFVYRGPDINVGTPTLSNAAAVQRVFDWFLANGGPSLPITGTPAVRGVSPQIGGSLGSPFVWEYAGGVTRQFGARAALRADASYRDFKNFYVLQTDTTTGKTIDNRSFAPAAVRGRQYDLSLVKNEDSGLLKRKYAALTLQAQYRFSSRVDVGGNYTLSHLWGNVDGENVVSGPLADSSLQYPEYKQTSWNFPEGDLSIDQRHRARLWVNYGLPWANGLTVSLLQAIESGVPYSASNQNSASFNGVDPRSYVTNPGYLTPPDAIGTQYYYTARDAFRTQGTRRTDLAINYMYKLGGGSRALDLFVQGQIVNLFNQFQLCGCGANVFANGGNIQNQFIDTSVRTAASNPTLYIPFNPFTQTPARGVNWDFGPAFGHAVNRFAYTSPRQFRVTFGVRF